MAKLIPNETTFSENSTIVIPTTGITKIPATSSLSWWNATKSIRTSILPFGSVVCPPDGRTFYESTDPNGESCLRKFQQLPPFPITVISSESVQDKLQFSRKSEGSFASDSEPTLDYIPFSQYENTQIATQVTEMYDVTADAFFQVTYEVGIKPQVKPFIYTIRNKCVDNPLRIVVDKPEYISIDAENIFDIPAQHTAIVSISINESPIQTLSLEKKKLFVDPIKFKVTPLDVMGIILVRTDLPPLVTNSIDLSTSQSVLPIPPEEFENIKSSLVGTTKWFNATKNIIVNSLPENSIVCPPGENSFYEGDDPNGMACLRNNNLLPNSYCSRTISLSGSQSPIQELINIVFVSSSETSNTSPAPVPAPPVPPTSSFNFLDSMQGADNTVLTSHTSDVPASSWTLSPTLGTAALQLDTRNSQQGLYVSFSGNYFQPTVYNSSANITFAAGQDVQFTTYIFGTGAGSLGSFQPTWAIRFCRSADETNYLTFSAQLETLGATTSSVFVQFNNSVGDAGISYSNSVVVPVGLVTFGSTLGSNLNTVNLWYIHESNPTTKVSIATLNANVLNALSGLLSNTGLSIDYPGDYFSVPTTELQLPLKEIKVYTP